MPHRLTAAAALVVVLSCASPSRAVTIGYEDKALGSLGIFGKYILDGERQEQDGLVRAWYDDEFELVLRVNRGNMSFLVDLQVADTEPFAGHDNVMSLDNYWASWTASDALTVRGGEYALNFGRLIGVYDGGGRNISIAYAHDTVDLGLSMGKVVEDGSGAPDDEDRDRDQFFLTASFKGLEPFSRLVLAYLQDVDQIYDLTNTYAGVDWALQAGPVALSGEFGQLGGDSAEGNFFVLEVGLRDLMPAAWDLTVVFFSSSEDYYGPITADEDYTPLAILFDEKVAYEQFTQAVVVTGSYAVSDRLSLNVAVVPLARIVGDQDAALFDFTTTPATPIPAEDGDSWGTEYGLGLAWKLADNVTYEASLARFTEGDVPVGDLTKYFNRFTFRF